MKCLRSPLTWGGIIAGLVVLVAVFGPVVSPYDAHAIAGDSLEEPSWRHLLGTNDIGQDLFSQLVTATRWALVVALGGAALAAVLGGVVGAASGLAGGAVDFAVMRVVDIALALPALPLMMVIAALAGPSRGVVILIVGLAGAPLAVRSVRAQALSLRGRGFVGAARGFGGGSLYLLRRHLLPALGPVIVASFLYWAPIAIFVETGLAFLGLSDPLAVSWGRILNQALAYPGLYRTSMWVWWVLPAGLAITVTVLGFGFLGIGMETIFNRRAGQHIEAQSPLFPATSSRTRRRGAKDGGNGSQV